MRTNPDDLLPMVPACAELRCGYLVGRDLALRGLLEVRWVGRKMFVTRRSVEAFKASQRSAEKRAAVAR
jgi:hypothetical protein